MKNRKDSMKGFTLIELLVVVLIIGILASVALPQYQKAVWKSRFSEAFITAGALDKSVQLYNLSYDGSQNGETLTANDLDIDVFTNMTLTNVNGGQYYCSKYMCYQVRCLQAYCDWSGYVFEKVNQQNELVEMGFQKSPNGWEHFCYYEPETSGTDLGRVFCMQGKSQGWERVEEGF